MSEQRGSNGQFREGCQPGPGRPKEPTAREAMLRAIGAGEVAELISLLFRIARDDGERTSNRLNAIAMLLDRRLGRVPEAGIEEQLDAIEHRLARIIERKVGDTQ
jgi:hypothetical protein